MSLASVIPYADAVDGDVGLLHGTGIISDAIETGERMAGEMLDGTAWSHAFIFGHGGIFEAVWPKIAISPRQVYAMSVTCCFRINVPDEAKAKALKDLMAEYLGKGYDLEGCAVGMAGLELAHAMDLPVDVNLCADKHKEFCSELGARYIDRITPENIKPSVTSPQGLYNFLVNLTK
jgi:hypothetical protein